ncbi:energy transducer TonB [Henriciella aquimarina]|uniref:energy transducer TonB n=1 Tax=Henriciella aquimarina TaxID=545261 RepID=UPI000A01A83D|nr:energy transducer TonB [Henriciella aquimarina]
MNIKRREKKSDTLEVRLPHSKKEAFKEACEKEGITASHAVRTFIDAYLRRSRRMRLKRITKELSMTLIHNPIKTTGGLAATGAALATITFAALPSTAEETYVEPIAPPTPHYPIDLAEEGISGDCTAHFDVSAEGFVETGIEVDCTHPGFADAVREAVETLRFTPKMEDGKPVRMTDVAYPISFQIRPDAPESADEPAPE